MSTAAAAVGEDTPFRPDHDWWLRLFKVIDSRDAAAFGALLTPDAQFRFGNAAVVTGSRAITDAVGGFFAAIAGCRHRLIRTLEGAGAVACEGEVTYTRHDGSTVTVPFANVFELQGERIRRYCIYIDNSPLFPARHS